MYMIITDLFDIDIHIFTVIKFLFNLVVKFKYIKAYTYKLVKNLSSSKILSSTFREYMCKKYLSHSDSSLKTCSRNSKAKLLHYVFVPPPSN